jgi:hypothetical protein
MKQSPARVALILLFIFIGCFGTAFAAAGMLTALPAPAVGGTCGPSTASETALEALAEPGSIGAGPKPPVSNVTAHRQWTTFVQQCQDLADRRGLASLAILVISLAVSAIGLIWVLRKPRHADGPGENVDGTTEWLVAPAADDPSRLVGAGAAIAPPPAPAYGTVPYPPQQQAWPSPPAAPYPYAATPGPPAAPYPYAATPAPPPPGPPAGPNPYAATPAPPPPGYIQEPTTPAPSAYPAPAAPYPQATAPYHPAPPTAPPASSTEPDAPGSTPDAGTAPGA